MPFLSLTFSKLYVNISDHLAHNSDMFRSKAKALHKTMWWKNCKVWQCIVLYQNNASIGVHIKASFIDIQQLFFYIYIYVSESDILGPIAYFSDIEKLVSFERAMFEDYNFKYRTNIFLLFLSILPH